MTQTNRFTFRLSLALERAILLCVCILLLSPGFEQASGPTMCGKFYQDRYGHTKRGIDWLHHRPRVGTSIPVAIPQIQKGTSPTGLRLRTFFPPDVLGENPRPICGEPWKDDEVIAAVWGGLSQWKHVGWVTRPDQRNCKALIKVQAHRIHGEYAPVVTMAVRDGGALGIPPLDDMTGCQELSLTRGAFRALGVSPEEEGTVRYWWDFARPPV